ncbi:MAG: nitroreductase family protein [Gracilibacteraceae bacterium]|jgi:nitroreductase|nr:nitroreductase family protein [Gracilibacteraceae bacterium]
MANEFLDLIKSRRSTRNFKPEQVSQDKLNAVIEAGLYAPSGNNAQSWHFTVIQNQEVIRKMNEDLKEAIRSSDNLPEFMLSKMKAAASNEATDLFYGAPTLILVSHAEGGLFSMIDAALASENMMLAAHALELGSCWIGSAGWLFNSAKRSEYLKILQIPQGYSPSHIILICERSGSPAQAAARKENVVNYIN